MGLFWESVLTYRSHLFGHVAMTYSGLRVLGALRDCIEL